MDVIVWGALGRMGRAFCDYTLEMPEITVVAGVDTALPESPCPFPLFSLCLPSPLPLSHVVLELSGGNGWQEAVAYCTTYKVPLILASTAYPVNIEKEIADLAKEVPVLLAPNLSLGTAVLTQLCAQATLLLGVEYDVEIVEHHHRHKQDAPSGTALALAQTIAKARKKPSPLVMGRKGFGLRQEGEIGVHALRGGEAPGTHSVAFLGQRDSLTLTYALHSRTALAQGAGWACGQLPSHSPGIYHGLQALLL